jgi:hypothetical protein
LRRLLRMVGKVSWICRLSSRFKTTCRKGVPQRSHKSLPKKNKIFNYKILFCQKIFIIKICLVLNFKIHIFSNGKSMKIVEDLFYFYSIDIKI